MIEQVLYLKTRARVFVQFFLFLFNVCFVAMSTSHVHILITVIQICDHLFTLCILQNYKRKLFKSLKGDFQYVKAVHLLRQTVYFLPLQTPVIQNYDKVKLLFFYICSLQAHLDKQELSVSYLLWIKPFPFTIGLVPDY